MLEKMLVAKKKLIPESGFNVVGVDTYEKEPGEELYLIAHCETLDEAKALKEKYESDDSPVYIYDPTTV